MHVDQLINKFARTLPGVNAKECRLLHKLATTAPSNGVIVEIGSYIGKSTIFLAAGAMAGHGQKVYAIDPHENTYEHQQPGVPSNTLAQFYANLKAAEVEQQVVQITDFSTHVAPTWKEPIAMLFIDGDHRYEPAKADLKMFEQFCMDGAIIAMHDTVGRIGSGLDRKSGAAKAAHKHVLMNKNFRAEGLRQSITYARYRPQQRHVPLVNFFVDAKRRFYELVMFVRIALR